MDNEAQRRRGLTFEQAEGIHPLPSQLNRTEVSPELRAVLWSYIHERLSSTARREVSYLVLGSPWKTVLKAVHVYRNHLPADEFSNRVRDAAEVLKHVFMKGGYTDIYGWLQFVLQQKPGDEFSRRIDSILQYCRAPYRVIDNEVLCPIGSETDARSITKAFADLKQAGLAGSREHLRSAAAELTAGNFAGTVRDSIHAVESAVRVLEPSGDFSKALSKLEQKTNIHGALKKGFLSLYGFSSDEQGIRHPLLDKEAPSVDEADAMFMIGACSAFLSYLINKSRAAGLLA